MTDWQPVATAPKDGTPLLLFYAPQLGAPLNGLTEGGCIEGWWFSSPKKLDDGWESIIGFIGEPTHWMPLPLTPE